MRTVPVHEKITLGGKPPSNTTLMFIAVKDKGNQSASQPFAETDEEGNYQLVVGVGVTKRDGSPPGWYRVVVETWEASQNKGTSGGGRVDAIPR